MIEKKIKHTSDEYSISPISGRLRKRIRKKKKTVMSKSKMKRYLEYFMWILIIGAFIYSLVVVVPELGLMSDKNPNKAKTK